MKTIRHNTYETNSSSTHAYSVQDLNRKNRPDLNIIPGDDGFIRVGFTEMTESTPQNKIVVSASVRLNNKWEKVDNLREVTNPKFNFDTEEEDDWETLNDEWYSFTNEYGHGSINEFCGVMNEIGRTEENLKIFIFSSNQGVHVESYYD